jgi:hypothetical protein
MQGCHLRIVCQEVRVSTFLEDQVLDDALRLVLNSDVQESLPDLAKQAVHRFSLTRPFLHLVHLNEFHRLVMLNELDVDG